QGSAPEVWAVVSGGLQLVDVGRGLVAAQRPVVRDDVDEGGADGVPHGLRAADVNVAPSGEHAPHECTGVPDPVLNVLAAVRPFARGDDVHVVEHALGLERGDLVAVDAVEAGRPD